mmetsp:Transcript_26130/g.26358  ORF Transcript_26130/g.26358 Transcript_26130/m.26358 type:complete len:382 (+) Transcript_26130:104-1249(+)|eukprot:CAMPEP_0182421774 /NCGR_PEP_ID=MMETSP1167-20130531/7260_1 /TAXON_ID=2988 /ORGANISM="Mallomonas Sp, Strain CCMP3275" /LENGTH=381 /DNA_ID=CAMNT_0024599239 /DNA_START=89 /DNA_END=1234 /DNA_ORIENTATION=+
MMVNDASVIRKVLQDNGQSIWKFTESVEAKDNEEAKQSEDAKEVEESNEPSLPSVSKKKKKKSKKKKSKTSAGNERRVHWGDTEEILFERDLSYDAIPKYGNHPLGLGLMVDRQTFSTDAYILSRRSDLMKRAKELGISKDYNDRCSSSITDSNSSLTTHSSITTFFPMETRQYDYKPHGVKNPLFNPIDEEIRIRHLTSSQSNSTSKDKYSQNLTEIHNDLKQIRMSREKTQSGCSCKPVKVDKLSLGKMKSELHSQGHLIGLQPTDLINMSKSQMISKMKELSKYCPLCVENRCECVQLGLGCSSDICGCLKHGYRPGKQQVCSNSLGRTMFHADSVREYRKGVIQNLNVDYCVSAASLQSICSPVDPVSTTPAPVPAP